MVYALITEKVELMGYTLGNAIPFYPWMAYLQCGKW